MFVMYVQEHWGSMMNLLVQCSTGKFRGKSQTLGERKRVLDFKRGNHFLNFYSSFRYGYQFFFFFLIGNTRTIITYQKKKNTRTIINEKKKRQVQAVHDDEQQETNKTNNKTNNKTKEREIRKII